MSEQSALGAVDADFVEEGTEPALAEPVRRLPAAPLLRREIEPWREDALAVALVAAGGVVAGAATVAAVRAVKGARKPSRRARRKQEPLRVLGSRSFLVDVHLLER